MITRLDFQIRWNTFVVKLSQRAQEVRESSVPRVRVVQVTRVSCALHRHHSVIGQIAEVPEWQLSQLSVLVAVNDQRGDLEEIRDKKQSVGFDWRCQILASVQPVASSTATEGVLVHLKERDIKHQIVMSHSVFCFFAVNVNYSAQHCKKNFSTQFCV